MKKLTDSRILAIQTIVLQVAIVTFLFGLFKITNVLIIVFALTWLIDKKIKQKIVAAFSNPYVWLFISYFLLTLVGFIHSENLKVAGKFLEMRIVVFLLPVIISTVSFDSKHVRQLLSTFTFGTASALIIGFVYSIYLFTDTGDSGYFFNDNLTLILDNKAAYFAMYVNVAVVITLFSIKEKPTNIINYALLGLLIVFQFLLATRISILTLFLILLLAFIFIVSKYNSKVISITVASFVLLVTISFILMPQTINRFESMFSSFDYRFDNPNEVNHFNSDAVDQENWNGLTLRLALWECGVEVIKGNLLFGVGTGDYDQAFRSQLERVNFIYAKKMEFGVHNQYLYTWMSFGLIGFLVFLVSLFLPAYHSLRGANYLFIMILLVFCVSFITENVLNRYLGVFPFTLLTSLIFFKKKN